MTVPDNEKLFTGGYGARDLIILGYNSTAGVDYDPEDNHFYFKVKNSYSGSEIDLRLSEAKRLHEHLGTLIADYEADKPVVPKNSDIIAGLKPGSIFTLEGPGLVHTWVRIIGGARNVANDSQCSAFYLWDNDDTNLVVVFENTN